jgi:molybdopterin converting factor small subunit
MTVTILLFAQASDLAGRSSISIELPEGSRAQDALAAVLRAHPALEAIAPHLAIAVNGALGPASAPLPPRAEIALLPPVSGG